MIIIKMFIGFNQYLSTFIIIIITKLFPNLQSLITLYLAYYRNKIT